MDTIALSRILTGLTLGFHIIFLTIGIGVPLFLSLTEGLGIWKKDPHYLLLARRWSRGLAITVAIGVVTVTIIGLQIFLLWPSFMRVAGHAISLPLFMETFAFFYEAIFLAIYLYTWDRLPNLYHWLLSLPITLGGLLSALFIASINSFMNLPSGFILRGGVFSDIQPLTAMFNPATPSKVSHILSSSLLTSASILAAIAAYRILQGRKHIYYIKALRLCMAAGILFAILTAVSGNMSANYLTAYQSEKLAPGGDHSSGNLPPLFIHYFFDFMILAGIYLLVVSFLYFLASFKKKVQPKWLMGMIVFGGPLSMLAIEMGWIFSEMGRQPWIIRGYLTTDTGVTTASGVGLILPLFVLLYLFLGTVYVLTLIRLFRKNTPEAEMEERGIC